jgi:hypothetical protein
MLSDAVFYNNRVFRPGQITFDDDEPRLQPKGAQGV